MGSDTIFHRLESDQEIRERLLDVVSDFQVRFLALQGKGTKIVNPFGSLEQIFRKYVNPLSLFLNDIRQQIETGHLTYIESLEKIALFCRRSRFRDEVIMAIRELEVIEKEKPYFLFALHSLIDAPGAKARGDMVQERHHRLKELNQKCQQIFLRSAETDLLPWRIRFGQSEKSGQEGTYERPNQMQIDNFKTAILRLAHHLVGSSRQVRLRYFWAFREIEREIIAIAEMLFDFGFTVEKIATAHHAQGVRKYVEDLLNDHILSELEVTASTIGTTKEISYHIFRLSLLNLKNIIPVRDFCRITDYKQAMRFATQIEKAESGNRFYRRVANLYQKYQKNKKGMVAPQFLNFVFSRAYYDYRSGQTVSFGGDFSRTFIFPAYFNAAEVQEKAEDEISAYSSKGKEEMLSILHLLLGSLVNPHQFHNKELAVLGEIESGAMGQVSIGILKGNLVALKKPTASPGEKDYPRLLKLLKHEARIHGELLQEGADAHKNIVECYGLVQNHQDIMLALGYYPADNLENLIEKNRRLSQQNNGEVWNGLTLEIIRRVFMQMVDTLLYLKRKKVIHRDLKPANILFLTDVNGMLNTLKLIDFGVSCSFDPAYATDLFQEKTVGTLNYMAPEQLLGKEGYESDCYALGASIYSLLTGRTPLMLQATKDFKEKLRWVYRRERAPVLGSNPALGKEPELVELSKMVDQMLNLDPSQRPTIEELQKKLERVWMTVNEVDPKRFLLPIRYTQPGPGSDQASLQRTTSETLPLGGL